MSDLQARYWITTIFVEAVLDDSEEGIGER